MNQDIVIIVYDICNKLSYDAVNYWLKDIRLK